MATPYNHREVEQKWRKNWEEHPVNVNDGKKPKYILKAKKAPAKELKEAQ